MTDPVEHPRRRSTDHGIRLPPELFDLPDSENPALAFLLGQLVEKLNTNSSELAEIKPVLTNVVTTLDANTKALADVTKKVDALKTAITVSGIFDTAKSLAPVLAVLTVIITAGMWIWNHVRWST